uniref:Uncharacterized protein n=1 Tax=Periophthalmus magnuspinnatus TaxID=409849 RepID=A0A3B4A573_9GOBI
MFSSTFSNVFVFAIVNCGFFDACFCYFPQVLIHLDPEGNFTVLDFEEALHFHLINVHAPNDELERNTFFVKTDIVSCNNVFRNDVSSTLKESVSSLNMTEVWHILNTQTRAFSRRQVVYLNDFVLL